MTIDAQGWASLAIGAATIVNAMGLIYVARFKLDEIEARLPGTKIVVDAKSNWGSNDIRARMYRLGMVYISLTVPKHWSKRGLVNLKEINELPRSLVLWVLIPGTAGFFVLLSLYVSSKGVGFSS